MAGNTVVYEINLRDMFSPVAENIGRMSKFLNDAMAAVGKAVSSAQEALNAMKPPPGFNRIIEGAKGVARAISNIGDQAKYVLEPLGKIGQGSWQSRYPVGPTGGSRMRARGGPHLHINEGIGLMALSQMGRNHVLDNYLEFEEQKRLLRGSLAGQLSDDDNKQLSDQAMKLASGSRFTAADMEKLFLTQGTSGVPIRDKDGALLFPKIAKQMMGISIGTGEGMDETFKTHLAIQRGFKLPFEAFPHISDTIAKLHQKTGISLGQISTQMGQVAAPAGQLAGWSEEETAAALGILAQRGLGSQAGSGLSRLIGKTANWSKPAAEFWEKMGISKDQVLTPDGHMKGPADLMQLLEEHSKGMQSADVTSAFYKMFGDRGVKMAASLLGSSSDLRSFTEDLKKVKDLAEKMGQEGSQGAAAGIANLSAAIKNLDTGIMEGGVGEKVGEYAGKLGQLLDWARTGPQWAQNAAAGVSLLGNALSSLAMPLLAASILLPMVTRGAVGLIGMAGGLGGIGAAFVLGATVYEHWDRLAEALTNTKKALDALIGGKGSTGDVAKGVADFASGLMPGDIGPKLQDSVTKSVTGAGSSANSIVDGIQNAVKTIQQSSMKIDIPSSIDLNVHVDGAGIQPGSTSASLPIAASRGTHQDAPGAWQRDN
jgi:TP901 family phage tail tape measure protein